MISLVRHIPVRIVKPVIESLEAWFKARTKLSSDKLVVGTALDLMTRSKNELVAENALLRQQLIVLKVVQLETMDNSGNAKPPARNLGNGGVTGNGG